MREKIKTHLALGRLFAAPIVITSVLLGVALGGQWNWLAVMVSLGAMFGMCYSHSFNSFLDWQWTKFDQGTVEERSKEKLYTGGQNLIAKGLITPKGVLFNGLAYLAISATFIGIVAWKVSPIIWLFWVLSCSLTFLYSWGKKHYLCEVALGLGFGPIAVMMGAASQTHPDFLRAFLAGLPLAGIFGFAMETWDQAKDWDVNWEKGLRNIGSWTMKSGLPLPLMALSLLVGAYLSQLLLIQAGVLSVLSGLSLIALPGFIYASAMVNSNEKAGVFLGLGSCFLAALLLTLGQAIGG